MGVACPPRMDRIVLDLRLAVRSLKKRPAFTAVAVLTLALGTGVTTAIFSIVYGILLRPLPYEAPERIVMLWQTPRDNPGPSPIGTTSHLNYLDWRRRATSFEAMALYGATRFVLSGPGDAEVVRGAIVTPGFFESFAARPVHGRAFVDADDVANGPGVVIVSHAFWMDRMGGREDVVGSTIQVSGRSMEIVGVAPPGFDFPRGARLWRPVQNDDEACGRGCVYTDGVARLRTGVSVERARGEMDAIARQLERQYPEANTNVAIGVATLKDATVGGVRPALRMLLGSVGMVLLIACANVANLLLARGAARRPEMAVRAALGASERRLFWQLSLESVVLAALGATFGLLLATWAVDLVKQLAPPGIPRLEEIGLDLPAFLFAGALVAVTALVFGLAPSLQLARVPLVDALREGARGATGAASGRFRFALLVAEIALSLVLLLGAGLLLRSFARLQAVDPGWRAEGVTVFTLSLPPSRYADGTAVRAAFDEIDRRLGAVPGVERVGRIQGLPLGPSVNVLTFTRPDRPAPPPGQSPAALYRSIDPDYFAVMDIPLVAGRSFTPADRDGSLPVIVISREMAERYWPGENPLEKRVAVSGQPERTIVGVVAGVRSESLSLLPSPEMYLPHAQVDDRVLSMVLASDRDPGQVIAEARAVVRSFDPLLPLIGPSPMRQLVDGAMAQPRFYLLLMAMFSILAVALAAVGIYGVVAYVVGQRTREIGVRMALGASGGEVVRLVVWQGVKPAIAGTIVGLAVALGSASVVRSLLYEVAPRDTATMAGMTVLLLGVSVLACVIPALRATRIEATTALRSE